MRFRSIILVLTLMSCSFNLGFPQVTKNYTAEPPSHIQDLLDRQIVTGVKEAFENESLSTTRHGAGIRPGVTKSVVRKPRPNITPLGPNPAAGNWSLNLADTRLKHLSLNLYQSEDAVFGYGNLTDNGTIEDLTVGGTIMSDRLAMYAIPGSSQNLYRMWFTLRPGSMEGSYLFSSLRNLQYGSAIGTRI